jgi:hypothetical protein
MPLAANGASMSWRFLLSSEPLIIGRLFTLLLKMEDDVKQLMNKHKELAALLLQEPDPWSA